MRWSFVVEVIKSVSFGARRIHESIDFVARRVHDLGRMMREKRVDRPVAISIAALGLAISVAFSACYTGDQSCSEAYNPNDPNDHCPYGPPGGPKLSEDAPACAKVPQLDKQSAECQVGFPEVYARLEAPDGGNCSNNGTGCHSLPVKGIEPFGDPQGMLDALAAYKGEIGRKYFDPDNPTDSWWVCNLRGDAGKLMPQNPTPRMSSADIALVERWLGCGAPLNAPVGGTGGMGGAGGEGGGL